MSAMVSADALVSIRYSVWPIFAVPVGSTRFCALTALTTSAGVSPFDINAFESMSTATTRVRPPYGNGTCAPGIVISCGRRKFSAMSASDCSLSVLLDSPSWITGMLDAE